MKIIRKNIVDNGKRVHICLCGIKIYSRNNKDNANINGTGNVVQIPKNSKISVHIYGNNNKVIIENSCYVPSFTIYIGTSDGVQTDNCTVHIGKNFSAAGGFIRICEDNTVCEIGEDCMFSSNISMWCSDTHTITYDGKCANVGKFITLGKHVWVGYGVTMLKNTIVSDNSIIGAGAVVGGKFNERGVIIAGNPAKVVKSGINWDRRRPKQYIEEEKNK